MLSRCRDEIPDAEQDIRTCSPSLHISINAEVLKITKEFNAWSLPPLKDSPNACPSGSRPDFHLLYPFNQYATCCCFGVERPSPHEEELSLSRYISSVSPPFIALARRDDEQESPVVGVELAEESVVRPKCKVLY